MDPFVGEYIRGSHCTVPWPEVSPSQRRAPHPSAAQVFLPLRKDSIPIPVPTLQTTQLDFSILVDGRPQTSVFPDPSLPLTPTPVSQQTLWAPPTQSIQNLNSSPPPLWPSPASILPLGPHSRRLPGPRLLFRPPRGREPVNPSKVRVLWALSPPVALPHYS